MRNTGSTKRLAAALFGLAMIATACGGASDYSTDDAASAKFEEVGEAIAADSGGDVGSAEDSAEEFEMSDSEAAPTTAVPASFQDDEVGPDEAPIEAEPEANPVIRTVIRRATMHLQVENVLTASNEATILIESFGGFVFGQETSIEGEARSSLTFKVAPEDFQKVLNELAALGFLRDQTVTADDVTGRVVDLGSQILTKERSIERLREFLSDANDIATITTMENSLLERETQLELIRGQLRTIQAQAALATITVVFTEKVPGPVLEVDVTAYGGHDGGTTCDGDDELTIDEDDLVTLCYRLSNTGDTYLSDFSLRDGQMKLDQDDFLEVKEGSLDRPLAPGDHLTLYVEVVADPDRVAILGQVGAVPTDELGNSLDIEGIGGRDELRLSVNRDESVPTFSDGLDKSLDALKYVITVLVLLAGVALPWVPFLVGFYFLSRWWRNRPKKAKARKQGKQVQPLTSPTHAASNPAPPAPGTSVPAAPASPAAAPPAPEAPAAENSAAQPGEGTVKPD